TAAAVLTNDDHFAEIKMLNIHERGKLMQGRLNRQAKLAANDSGSLRDTLIAQIVINKRIDKQTALGRDLARRDIVLQPLLRHQIIKIDQHLLHAGDAVIGEVTHLSDFNARWTAPVIIDAGKLQPVGWHFWWTRARNRRNTSQ